MFPLVKTGWTPNKMSNKILIGITGGIGSGKSEAINYLRSIGENVICADEISRELVAPGSHGNKALKRAFGEGFFFKNGELNRKKLAQLVFSDNEKRKELNAILHPLIAEGILEKASDMKGRVFIEAAVLIEGDMHKKTDYIWLFTADLETRICRIAKRDGLSREQALRIINCQMSDEMMMPYADEIIDNSFSMEKFRADIDALLKKKEYEVS